jgi:hypothetical protein
MAEYKSEPWYCFFDDPEMGSSDLDELMDGCESLAPRRIEECCVIRRFWIVQTFDADGIGEYHEFKTFVEAERFSSKHRQKAEALE